MLRDQKRYQGMWKPQLGPVDETPYKIDRADLQLEELLSGLRGDLALLRAQFSKAQGAGTLTPSTEAIYRRKIARTMYQIWGE
jgi:ribosomal protein L29